MGVANYHTETNMRATRNDMDPVSCEELLRRSSVWNSPRPRAVSRFPIAFVPQLQLWHVHYILSVELAGRPALVQTYPESKNRLAIT